MSISVIELGTALTLYTALTGSGLYWLWHRALSQTSRATWAVAVVVAPVPALVALGLVRPGWPQR